MQNQYTRAVLREGNPRALEAIDETMELRESLKWRGLGALPWSGLRLREAFAAFDAELRWELPACDDPGREGVPVRRGAARRAQAVGVPRLRHGVHAGAPLGTCMVSAEGACAAAYMYGSEHSGASAR